MTIAQPRETAVPIKRTTKTPARSLAIVSTTRPTEPTNLAKVAGASKDTFAHEQQGITHQEKSDLRNVLGITGKQIVVKDISGAQY